MPLPPAAANEPGQVRCRLLGEVSILDPAGNAVDLSGPTVSAVLATLVLAGPAGASIDAVVEAVWGEPGAASRDSVYHYVAALRRVLSRAGVPAAVRSRRPGYRLDIAPGMVDWQRFGAHSAAGRAAQAAGDLEAALASYERALRLWTGPPLAGIGDRLAGWRHAMRQTHQAVREDAATCHLAVDQPQQVLDLLGHPARQPASERAAALVIQALAALGRRDEAGAVYHRMRTDLADRLGLDPGPGLAAVYRQALRGPAEPVPIAAAVGPARAAHVVSGLPRPSGHFTGRADLLHRIVTALAEPDGPRICVLHGMGGVGKTSLAVHAAHQVAGSFPGGCLFMDLHGHTPGTAPVPAAEALDRLLRRLGVPGAGIPDHIDDRAALYRDQLAGRRLLLVLDNAHDAAQARPLLPATGDCGVLVTSRRRLAALDDAHSIVVGTLPPADAAALFRAVAGARRLAAESAPAPSVRDALSSLVDTCGYLPLAIRIAAARYRTDPTLTLPALADSLDPRHIGAGTDVLDDGERSITATLATSLTELPSTTRRRLLQLALHPGTHFDAHAAQALTADPNVRDQLAELVDRHLIDQLAPGRYQFHDLIAALARGRARRELAGDHRACVLARVVDYYLAAAARADEYLTPGRYRPPLQLAHPPADLPAIESYRQALTWFTDNHGRLLDSCRTAFDHGWDAACWQIAFAAREYYYTAKHLDAWRTTHQLALLATRRLGDRRAEAMTLNNLGLAALEAGAPDTAAGHYRHALDLFRTIGEPHGEHTALANHAWIAYQQGHYQRFLSDMDAVLAFYEHTGATRNAAITLRGIGLAETELGRTGQAIGHLNHALSVFDELDLPLDSAMALNALGEAHRHAGDLDRARQAHEQALVYADRAGSISERARARHRLGTLALTASRVDQAREHWSRAIVDYQNLADPRAGQLSTELAELDQ